MLPLKGVSAIDAAGQAFDDPDARQALFDAIRQSHGHTELVELEHHINDAEFAEAAARKLLHLMRREYGDARQFGSALGLAAHLVPR